MKKLGGWVFYWLTAISFAWFVVALALWLRTLATSDTLYWSDKSNHRMVWVYWCDGAVEVEFVSGDRFWGIDPGFHFIKNFYPDIPVWAFSMSSRSWHGDFLVASLGYCAQHHSVPGFTYSVTSAVMPLWVFAFVTGVLPAIASVRYWKMLKDVAEGRCANCGYDLRATPERCPECGMIAREKGYSQ